jgi:glycosyltransferase involved in cell wall biosynthesis
MKRARSNRDSKAGRIVPGGDKGDKASCQDAPHPRTQVGLALTPDRRLALVSILGQPSTIPPEVPLRICLYTNTALPKLGGQELVVDALARQFQSAGHEVLVLAPQPRRPLRPDDARLPYIVVRHPRFRSARYFVGWYGYFLRAVQRRFHFDVVHCHGIDPPGFLAAANRGRLAAPVIITSHGGDLNDGSVRLSKHSVRRRCAAALQSADALVAISRFTEDGYRRVCSASAPIVRIPNGVEMRQFAGQVSRPVGIDAALAPRGYLLYLGRVVRRKGIDTLLQALARIPPAERTPLVIAGDGKDRRDLQDQTAELGLRNEVRFVGAVHGDSKTWLLKNALATVMPCRLPEAFPLVVLESHAAGTPVVGTLVPGLADLIDAGQTGALVPPESPAALAEILRELIAHPDTAWRWGERARQAAAGFDWPIVARRHIDLYERLLAGLPAIDPAAADQAA